MKIKDDLVSKKKGLASKNSEDSKSGKVDDLHPKTKNMPENLKSISGSVKVGKKIGSVEHLPLSVNLKKKK